MPPEYSVLYVDDEPDLLEIAKIFLEQSGEFRVDTVTSATAALEAVASLPYDAIISDYQMPGTNGIQFLKAVRKQAGDIPFILFTGRGREEIVIEAINNGADFYLQKGGDPAAQFAELAHKLRQAVARRTAELSRTAAEEALRESEERQSLFIRHAPAALAMFDTEMRYLAASRRWMADYHLGDRDILGHSHYEIFPEISDELRAVHRRCLAGEVLSADAERFVRVDGSVQWVAWEARPWFTAGNHVGGIIICSEDITGRRRAEEALRKSEERLRTFLDSATDAFSIWDAGLNLVDLNQAALAYLPEGTRKEEILGRNLRGFISGSGEWAAYERYLEVLRTGEPFAGTEQASSLPSGKRWMNVRCFRVGDGIGIVTTDVTRQKEAEDELRESEEKYRSLVENANEAITIIQNWRLVYANRRMADLAGIPAENLAGMPFPDLVWPGDREELEERYGKRQSGEKVPNAFDFRMLGPGGRPLWIHIMIAEIQWQGRPATLNLMTDITGRKGAEAALRESEGRFRRLAENATDLIYRMSLPEARYEYVSPASLAITGYSPGEFYADPGIIFRLVHPAWKQYIEEQQAALHRGEAPPVYEFQIIDRSGKTRWINQRNVLLKNERGEAVAIEGIATDITRQKETERDLRMSEERFLAVSDNAGSWIWEVDPDGLYRYSSPAIEKILGYRPDEVVGKLHFYDLFDPSERARLKDTALAAFAFREAFREFLNLNRHKDGTPVLLRTSGTPIYDENGTFTGYCGIDEDITRQAAAESALDAIVRSMVGTTGLDSLRKITGSISSWLPADCVMVGEIQPDRETVNVLSMLLDGKEVSGFSYTLRGTPCENVAEKGFCIYPDDAVRLFPESRDLVELNIRGYIGTPLRDSSGEVSGILCALSRAPIKAFPSTREILDIIAVKAAAEVERLRIERELQKSEERFRSLIETSPDIIWESDLQGRFRYISPVVATILGYTPEEIAGMSVADFLTGAEGSPVLEMFAKYIAGEDIPSPIEITTRHRDGTGLVLEIHPWKVTGPDGNIAGLRGIAVDVTGRRRAEEAFRESEEKFRSIVETSPNIVWERDTKGHFRYISPAITGILGYTPEEMMSRPLHDFITEAGKRIVGEALARIAASGSPPRTLEIPLLHRDGREVILEIRPGMALQADGTIGAFRGVAIDITERKRTEEAIRESRRQLAEAMDIANLVNWEYDVATNLFTFDDRFYALYGTTEEREGGSRMSPETYAREFLHPDDRHLVAVETGKALRATDPGYQSQVEHRIVRRDGTIRHIVVRIRITRDADGRTVKTYGANQDITERKMAEEALNRANRQLGLLSSITRHDILNKITIILGFVKIAGRKNDDPAVDAFLRKIEAATDAIREEIEFTTVYEKLGTTKPQWIDPGECLQRLKIPEQIALHAGLDRVMVYADPMLDRVFSNLLDNSVRHGGHVTEIRVPARTEGGCLVINWEDNGVGIPAGDKDRIFERGFGKNTGLGMFLVREILALTGITIRETGETGMGARFEMTVPEGVWRTEGTRSP